MDLKLLITDDETLDREGLRRQLDWTQFSINTVFTAKDGSTALEILKDNDIDILFTDIKMPIMSGIELAQLAREMYPSIEIVFISGYDDFSYAKMAIHISVYEYILKPVCTDELTKCVINLVERIKEQRAEAEYRSILLQIARDSEKRYAKEMTHSFGNKKTNNEIAVEKIIMYVETNYKENISLNKIAKTLYYTPNYLGKIFKIETNQKFNEYLIEYRIKQAAKLLQDKQVKVLEAAMSVGYKDMPTFIKRFKNVYGITPSEYRKYER